MEIASTRGTLPAISRLTLRSAAICLASFLAMLVVAAPAGCRRHPGGKAARDAGAPATSAIEGRVSDKGDRPVPEARVLAFAQSGNAGPSETSTDAQGRFRLERLTTGSYRLLVEAAGFPAAEKAPVAAPAIGVAIRVDGEGRTIVGRVLSRGAPVIGARVWLGSDSGGPARRRR
jgi:hypothetical protein